MRATIVLVCALIVLVAAGPAQASRSSQQALNNRQVLYVCQHFFRTCANIRLRHNAYTANCTTSTYSYVTDRGPRMLTLRNCG
jgi:hypothetical protein